MAARVFEQINDPREKGNIEAVSIPPDEANRAKEAYGTEREKETTQEHRRKSIPRLETREFGISLSDPSLRPNLCSGKIAKVSTLIIIIIIIARMIFLVPSFV